MLELKQCSVFYRQDAPVLRDIDLTLTPGITAVIGHNGAGKSTLLHAILGLVPHTGEILLKGKPLLQTGARDRAAMISLLPQMLPAPALTVRECIALGFSPRLTHPGEGEWERVEKTEDMLGLSALDGRRVSTLSGGERQRVFLALALVQDTPILLLDEPTAHMDLTFLAPFRRVLQDLREQGKCILAVLHDLNTALQWADRILLVENGSIAFDGTPAACIEAQIPERHFSLTRYTATAEDGSTAHFYRA